MEINANNMKQSQPKKFLQNKKRIATPCLCVFLLTKPSSSYKMKYRKKGVETMNEILDIITDTLLDTVKLIPFLFIAFIIIEYIEHNLSNKTLNKISKSGKLGPILGSLLGLIPQCGFGALATNLYIARIISLGTLISIYLATSDEMLPILLSEQVSLHVIVSILITKFFIGLIFGYIIDFFFRKNQIKKEKINEICNEEHCGCNHNHNIFYASLIHTLKTIFFIALITFVLNSIFEYFGNDYITSIFHNNSLITPFLSGLVGLIPNCGSSIIITELYTNGVIKFSSLLSGLLTGSGISLLILFKSNKNRKENLMILSLVYCIGVFVGILIEIINLFL